MPEPQELLEMRLLALAQDIAKVKRVTEDAKRRREGHRRLADQVGKSDRNSIRGPLVKAKSLVSEIVEATESELDLAEAIEDRHEDWIERLTALRDDLQNALDRLKRVEAELRTTSDSMDRIDTDLDSMTSSLDARCGELDAEVKALQKRLSDGDQPRQVWKAYEDTLHNGCQDLFADYVDCLGGLTLRDTSLDDNVCAITDALLKEIPARVKHLAVPARRPTLSTALHGLVKLGFPEWTIWSVPLVGYETGLLHARGALGRQVIERSGDALRDRSVQVRQELFAEAYAAYTVGPAYGCAAMLLRFQPNRDDPKEHDPSDVERAAVILGVLRKITQHSAGFRDVMDRTREYWREAVGHLGGLAAADTAEDALRPYAAAVADELREAEAAGFDARRWDVVDGLTAMLRTDLPQGTRAPDKVDVRTLLNAAWTVRLANPVDRTLPSTIARNVEILWRSISGSKGRVGGSHDRP